MKNTTYLFIAIVIVSAAAVASTIFLQSKRPVAVQQNVNQTAAQPSVIQPSYVNDNYKVSLNYSAPLVVGTPRFEVGNFFTNNVGSQALLSLVLEKENYPGTNFYEAFLNLAVQKNVSENDCAVIKQDGAESSLATTTEKINDRVWYKALARDAAAGTLANDGVYHTYANGVCYEAVLSLFQGNIANYDPPIKQVDEKMVFSILESVFNTIVIRN